jgi:drug/metabolite transporter (DMT)-like permease
VNQAQPMEIKVPPRRLLIILALLVCMEAATVVASYAYANALTYVMVNWLTLVFVAVIACLFYLSARIRRGYATAVVVLSGVVFVVWLTGWAFWFGE